MERAQPRRRAEGRTRLNHPQVGGESRSASSEPGETGIVAPICNRRCLPGLRLQIGATLSDLAHRSPRTPPTTSGNIFCSPGSRPTTSDNIFCSPRSPPTTSDNISCSPRSRPTTSDNIFCSPGSRPITSDNIFCSPKSHPDTPDNIFCSPKDHPDTPDNIFCSRKTSPPRRNVLAQTKKLAPTSIFSCQPERKSPTPPMPRGRGPRSRPYITLWLAPAGGRLTEPEKFARTAVQEPGLLLCGKIRHRFDQFAGVRFA